VRATDLLNLDRDYETDSVPFNLLCREQIGRDYPTKVLIISEFGYAGIFSRDSTTADKVWICTIQSQIEQFHKFEFVADAIFCYQDDLTPERLLSVIRSRPVFLYNRESRRCPPSTKGLDQQDGSSHASTRDLDGDALI
jgi:hypothetical protein